VAVQWKNAAPPTPPVRPAPAAAPFETLGIQLYLATPPPLELTPYFNDRVTADIQRTSTARPVPPSPRSPSRSKALAPGPGHVNATAGNRRYRSSRRRPRRTQPHPRSPMASPPRRRVKAKPETWCSFPSGITTREKSLYRCRKGRGIVFLMAGSTNHMQSRFGEWRGGRDLCRWLGRRQQSPWRTPPTGGPSTRTYFTRLSSSAAGAHSHARRSEGPAKSACSTSPHQRPRRSRSRRRATVLDLPLESGQEFEIAHGASPRQTTVVIGLMAADPAPLIAHRGGVGISSCRRASGRRFATERRTPAKSGAR